MRSTTPILISAMRILAADIQCDDGIANGAIHEAADRLEELSISHARYEFLRTLTPYDFGVIWTRNLRGERFDAVVDDMILERAKAVKNDAR